MYCAAQQYLCLKFSTISVSWTPCRDLFHPPVLSRPTRTSECLRWCLSSASGLGRSELLVLCPVSASPTSCSLFSWFSSCRPADRRCCLHLEASSPWAQVLLAFFSPVYYLNLYAPCGLLGVMCPWVDFWFWLFSCLYPLFFTFPYLSLLSFIRGLRGIMCTWFDFWFWHYIYCLFLYIVCFPTYRFFSSSCVGASDLFHDFWRSKNLFMYVYIYFKCICDHYCQFMVETV